MRFKIALENSKLEDSKPKDSKLEKNKLEDSELASSKTKSPTRWLSAARLKLQISELLRVSGSFFKLKTFESKKFADFITLIILLWTKSGINFISFLKSKLLPLFGSAF